MQYAIIQIKFTAFMETRMSSLAAQTIFTAEEYLALERKATLKSEYISGEILAMSGASNAHNLITLDIGTELNIQLRERECLVYTNDMRIRTSPIYVLVENLLSAHVAQHAA